jgi:spore germination protein GerM
MALIDNPDAARRLARAIASDVSLYNEEKIIQGILNDNLFEVMSAEIEEGRELYKSRVSPELYGSTNFYDRAIVDILVKSKGHIKSKIW